MKGQVKISIIIPAINEAGNLRKLLPLLKESGDGRIAEVIVADGGSTDESEAVCNQYGATYFVSPEKGRAAQMNHGVARATGDIFYFVHADAIPPLQYADDISNALDEGFPIGCYRFRFDSDRLLLRFNSYCTRFDRIMCRGGDQTLYVTREIFEEMGGYKPHFVVMEDYDFIIRARKKHPFKIMNGDVIVSARKYEHNSYLRVNFANLTVFLLFFAGVQPVKLLSIYKSMIKHPKA
jgi:rSAM/selenodomain-associated transferase 2